MFATREILRRPTQDLATIQCIDRLVHEFTAFLVVLRIFVLVLGQLTSKTNVEGHDQPGTGGSFDQFLNFGNVRFFHHRALAPAFSTDGGSMVHQRKAMGVERQWALGAVVVEHTSVIAVFLGRREREHRPLVSANGEIGIRELDGAIDRLHLSRHCLSRGAHLGVSLAHLEKKLLLLIDQRMVFWFRSMFEACLDMILSGLIPSRR